jgi:hypothetical protein
VVLRIELSEICMESSTRFQCQMMLGSFRSDIFRPTSERCADDQGLAVTYNHEIERRPIRFLRCHVSRADVLASSEGCLRALDQRPAESSGKRPAWAGRFSGLVTAIRVAFQFEANVQVAVPT